ncbi:MAG: prolyl oligopeptidase family serine peptidase [Pseudomonadota bacterium]
MSSLRLIAIFFLSLLSVSLISVSQADEDTPTIDDFFAPYDFWSAELSPSGKYFGGIRKDADRHLIMIFDLDDPESTPRFIPIGDAQLNWIDWVNDDRILVSFSIGMVTRIGSLNRDGGDFVIMFGDNKRLNKNAHLGSVVSFLRSDPDHIIMAARRLGDLDLFRLNVFDGTFERIGTGTDYTFAWFVDQAGEPVFRLNTNRRLNTIYVFVRVDRDNGSVRWKKIYTLRLNRRREDSSFDFRPLGPGPTETTYYVVGRPEGSDKNGVYLYDLEAQEYLEAIGTHPDVDVDDAVFHPLTGELQAVYYQHHRIVMEFQDETLQQHMEALSVYFGDQINVFPMHSDQDGDRWLIHTYGPTDPGSIHLYNFETNEIRPLGSYRHSFDRKSLGEVSLVEYEARDGIRISGYLTRPSGAEPDEKFPLVVYPHGGPEIRDVITFDPMVQFLVAQGYQVFQPNFRGSSGFGKAFADLGRRQWGRDMQTDIEDGFSYLVGQGFAERDQACIAGASYGGYAALAAATLTPDLYQCVIAIAAPTDLIRMLKWERREEGRNSATYQYVVEHIGDPREDEDSLMAVSPARLADRVTRPILLIHGEYDDVVPIKQAELMATALDKAGKSYTKIVLERSTHSRRGGDDLRTEWTAISDFLAEHLPVTDKQPAQPEQEPVSNPN